MPPRFSHPALALLSLLLAACLLVDHPLASVAAAVAASAFPLLLITLGAARGVGLQLGAVLLGVFGLLAGSFLALFALRGRVEELTWIAGLPLAAVVQLAGLWLVPLLLVSLAYALTFDRFGLSAEDLDRVRHAGRSDDPGSDPAPGSRDGSY